MLHIENSGMASLEMREAAEVWGGGGPADAALKLAGFLITAAGLGFTWGYENLGPFLNRFF